MCIRNRNIRKVCKHRPFWITFLLPLEPFIQMESVFAFVKPYTKLLADIMH